MPEHGAKSVPNYYCSLLWDGENIVPNNIATQLIVSAFIFPFYFSFLFDGTEQAEQAPSICIPPASPPDSSQSPRIHGSTDHHANVTAFCRTCPHVAAGPMSLQHKDARLF